MSWKSDDRFLAAIMRNRKTVLRVLSGALWAAGLVLVARFLGVVPETGPASALVLVALMVGWVTPLVIGLLLLAGGARRSEALAATFFPLLWLGHRLSRRRTG